MNDHIDVLVLRCGKTTLRAADDEDDDLIVSLLPDDFDHDPTFPRDPACTLLEHREAWLRHWLAGFRHPVRQGDWYLPFVVTVQGVPVGFQVLEGRRFREFREVDSSSFLVPQARGRGLGTSMRTAILYLAFEVLGAERAVSAARPGNTASHRVSERVGYISTGRVTPLVAGVPRPIDTYELSKHRWLSRAHPEVQVSGVLPSRVFASCSRDEHECSDDVRRELDPGGVK